MAAGDRRLCRASSSESSRTFTDYRLDVEFQNVETGQTLIVPGFFAADGNAANTGATSGNVWRVHFNPPDDGQWVYTASFRTGPNIAASTDLNAGAATSFNGESGSITVAAAATSGSGFRTDGMLVQDGHYYVHKGNSEVWIKGGSDSPENFLGYVDFDGTRDQNGGALKTWSAHQQDFNTGDPTWMDSMGSEIIGAINYLAEQGVNSQYMILMTANGDGRDVWPWTDPSARTTYDVSKLAQWEVVFEHMDNVGVAQHLVMQETENDQLLGGMTVERLVYYREMIARFGHHNGVTWNMGEENTNTAQERKDFMDYFKAVDPYDHPVVIHTFDGTVNSTYSGLLGHNSMDGMSLQSDNPRVQILQFGTSSAANGDPWLKNWDEVGPANVGLMQDGLSGTDANHDMLRAQMWGVLTAGGSGFEWYAGGEDQTNQDFALRESAWVWSRYAREFFEDLPVQQMTTQDSLTSSTSDFVFAKPGDVYAIYLPTGGSASLNLSGQTGTFDVTWFNPRTGVYSDGSIGQVSGGETVDLGTAPNTATEDWAILITKKTGPTPPPTEQPGTGGELPEQPSPGVKSLAKYYLVDTNTDQILADLITGSTVDHALVADRDLTIVAAPNTAHSAADSIESVRLTLDQGAATRVESVEPYALFGDRVADLSGGGHDFDVGQHNVKFDFYDADAAQGTLLGTESVSFTIGNTNPPPVEALAMYKLVDTDTDEILAELVEGSTIDATLVEDRNMTIVATANIAHVSAASIESIRLDFDGGVATRIENVEPYALFGDSSGNLRGALQLTGQHEVTFDFYDADGAKGTLLGTDSVSFFLV